MVNVPATGREEAVSGDRDIGTGRGYTAMVSSDWLPGLPRNHFTTGAQCFRTGPERIQAQHGVRSS